MFKRIRNFFKKALGGISMKPRVGVKKIEVEINVTDKNGNLKAYRKIKNGRTIKSSDA